MCQKLSPLEDGWARLGLHAPASAESSERSQQPVRRCRLTFKLGEMQAHLWILYGFPASSWWDHPRSASQGISECGRTCDSNQNSNTGPSYYPVMAILMFKIHQICMSGEKDPSHIKFSMVLGIWESGGIKALQTWRQGWSAPTPPSASNPTTSLHITGLPMFLQKGCLSRGMGVAGPSLGQS